MKYQVVGFIGLVALLGAVGCAGGAGDNKPKLAELREGATPAEVAFHNGMKAAIDDDWSAAASNFEEAINDVETKEKKIPTPKNNKYEKDCIGCQ